MRYTDDHPPPDAGRGRVVIEHVRPQIDCGRFPVKRVLGDQVLVQASIFADGHDALSARLLWRHESADAWHSELMEELVNDQWRADFPVTQLGRYQYTLEAWVDPFKSWRRDLVKRIAAGQDLAVDLLIGADILAAVRERVEAGADRAAIDLAITTLRGDASQEECVRTALDEALATRAARYPDYLHATRFPLELVVLVDPVRARFSTWYESFPRAASGTGSHSSFQDVEKLLDYVAGMNFDVLYLPPIHPIGTTHRKGRNNHPVAQPEDVGSPWAIGAAAGGHKAIHPQLGTLAEFQTLVEKARARGIEVALDIAFQVSPDHPYVKEHPQWFRRRPDGTVQYAENPPKKYEDIFPLNFDTEDWQALWEELASVFEFWLERGVRTFRVDNPHTKPFAFWEWLIHRLKQRSPDVILLSEAFTRPGAMYRLAKLGFTQSYTYFAWRNSKAEIEHYLRELVDTEINEFFRPNFWPNTPDILTEYLQTGGRAAFMARLVLAATLSANYGIYGPVFELLEHEPREPGSEEYLHSEKYEIRQWDRQRPDSLRYFIGRVNRIRQENPALQANATLRFHRIDNDDLIGYSKVDAAGDNIILCVVNLEPHQTRASQIELPLEDLGLSLTQPFVVHDLLSDARYTWQGPWNYIELNPAVVPAHIFRILKGAG